MLAGTSSSSDFIKADSRNLPKLEHVMILEYISSSNKHNVAEIRGAKMLMSSRDSYLNTAVGYVQVKRNANLCHVKAKIVPEHRINNKLYNVMVQINESENVILDSNCDDCAAAQGGCKHSLLLLFWLAKKSEEPSSTSVDCYWKKPTLSSIRTDRLPSKSIFPKAKKPRVAAKDPSVLQDFLAESNRRGMKDSIILNMCNEELQSYNLYDMTLQFIEQEPLEVNHSASNFIQYANACITENIVTEINKDTTSQSDNKYWHYIRQGRITASLLHQAAYCKTDGALVQQILGGYKVPETIAIKRGKKLEKMVLKEVEKKLHTKIEDSGFVLINGIIGASPDGVTEEFVIEIKCPTSQNTLISYVKQNKVQNKFKAQITCQMLACGKKKGLFCVADPNFEITKNIHLYWVDFDEEYVNNLILKATNFWKIYIFPKLLESAKK